MTRGRGGGELISDFYDTGGGSVGLFLIFGLQGGRGGGVWTPVFFVTTNLIVTWANWRSRVLGAGACVRTIHSSPSCQIWGRQAGAAHGNGATGLCPGTSTMTTWREIFTPFDKIKEIQFGSERQWPWLNMGFAYIEYESLASQNSVKHMYGGKIAFFPWWGAWPEEEVRADEEGGVGAGEGRAGA